MQSVGEIEGGLGWIDSERRGSVGGIRGSSEFGEWRRRVDRQEATGFDVADCANAAGTAGG